jgi:hypothetical protein
VVSENLIASAKPAPQDHVPNAIFGKFFIVEFYLLLFVSCFASSSPTPAAEAGFCPVIRRPSAITFFVQLDAA